MLYFTGEIFSHLANQNRGHIHVMLEYRLIRGRDSIVIKANIFSYFK